VLDDLLETMTDASLCAMGGLTPIPVQSALMHFAPDFIPDFIPDFTHDRVRTPLPVAAG
jgi:NADH:ubiquinone oxidoreductase subunit F (NADH-binding)